MVIIQRFTVKANTQRVKDCKMANIVPKTNLIFARITQQERQKRQKIRTRYLKSTKRKRNTK